MVEAKENYDHTGEDSFWPGKASYFSAFNYYKLATIKPTSLCNKTMQSAGVQEQQQAFRNKPFRDP